MTSVTVAVVRRVSTETETTGEGVGAWKVTVSTLVTTSVAVAYTVSVVVVVAVVGRIDERMDVDDDGTLRSDVEFSLTGIIVPFGRRA